MTAWSEGTGVRRGQSLAAIRAKASFTALQGGLPGMCDWRARGRWRGVGEAQEGQEWPGAE